MLVVASVLMLVPVLMLVSVLSPPWPPWSVRLCLVILTMWGLGAALLWGAFYVFRWIVNGFRRT